jgi:hypothetical protein
LFDKYLEVSEEYMESNFNCFSYLQWFEFLLNPRRLRGSDFLMRWSQGRWSEERLRQAINQTDLFYALPYGPSGTAPEEVREYELYFERLEKTGLGAIKRPDLLVFRKTEQPIIEAIVEQLGGNSELPFKVEEEPLVQDLLSKAIVALECENSLWKAQQMPFFGKPLTKQKRLNNNLGLPKNAVVPNVIIKEEDRKPLKIWQSLHGIKIHVWHAFYDLAFGIAFDEIENLINSGKIEATSQTFQSPGGQTSIKTIYKVYYHYAYSLGVSVTEPNLEAASIVDKNGHILPYVRFEGGSFRLGEVAIKKLESLASESNHQ